LSQYLSKLGILDSSPSPDGTITGKLAAFNLQIISHINEEPDSEIEILSN